jgi:hypothetical protein
MPTLDDWQIGRTIPAMKRRPSRDSARRVGLVGIALVLALLASNAQVGNAIGAAACLEWAEYELISCAGPPETWIMIVTGGLAVGLALLLGFLLGGSTVRVGHRISDGLALTGALLAFAFGVYLLVVGPETTILVPDGVTTTTRSPSLAGLVPLGIGVVAVWAVASRRTRNLWLAAGLAITASVLFLFSISLQLAAIAAILVLAAAAGTMTSRDIREH